MGAERRRPQDGFRLRLSTSNLPGTLFLLILIVCATVLMLSKGLNTLKEAYAETNREIPNPLVSQQNSSQPNQKTSALGTEEGTEDLANSGIKPNSNEGRPSTEHSSDYVLIPSSNSEPESETVIN